jgi:hypothetical protein
VAGRVAFGDDAAAAAGLAFAALAPARSPTFCADAVADPLAGVHGALAVLSTLRRGQAALLDVSLRDTARHAAAFRIDRKAPVLRSTGRGEFEATIGGESVRVARPHARGVSARAPGPGSDTDRVLRELAPGC